MALYRTGLYVKNHTVEQVQVAKSPIASFNGNVTGLYIPELIAYITAKQSGSGTPAPDNIRPIIGVSECNVVRTGVNLWDEEWELGVYNINTGGKSPATTRFRSVNMIPILPNTNYYCKASHTTLGLFYEKDGTFITGVDGSANYKTINNRVFSTPTNAYYMTFFIAETTYNNDISINYPSTDTDYHAYTGNIYTIQLGDTYYGGSLDVTTGLLMVTSKMYEFDGSSDENWVIHSSGAFQIATSDSIVYTDDDSKSNMFVVKPNKTTSQLLDGEYKNVGNNFYFKYSTATTLEDWKTFIGNNNLQVLATLNTPITVQLTPTQVEQLLGTNNVWADTGDVEVKFFNVIR